jgi:hypothetical protein
MALRCPHCGTDNPDDAYFCGSCGSQLRSSFQRGAGPVELEEGAAETVPYAPVEPVPYAPVEPPEPVVPAVGAVDAPSSVLPAGPYSAEALQDLDTAGAPAAGQPVPPEPYRNVNQLPPPPAQLPPLPPQHGMPPPSYPGSYGQGPYVPPPTGYGDGYVPAYAPPPDGNTSGLGNMYPPPPEAQGWTFAGCIPFGLFGFYNGSQLWGFVGLAGSIISLVGWIYAIFIGIQGKQLAWQNRRFESMQQYLAVMRAWNIWGIVVIAFSIVISILYFIFFMMLALSEGM